ncbi:NAD(P)/FAD-dependent oxidoreductase [Polynucleobacter sp. Latsch14-2]|jgi:L-2-hydroxyglutarate oxidase LhgO|uniref:NAD(P)/FAD-dependent oxidoreductase n=1 Tax=Polynucleobacter sp. Latsch14-2 TaxID=2576920 RepID=UPI001C0C7E1B|nr:NAD(P)/FAD-dependent oxidoreductase [Polynucleobacter sp. Latsch14-2]MBU3615438.1 NAD(P)/FAD-dependent oxidoreductase [Polynucleobacter sp. Latsch14-2]
MDQVDCVVIGAGVVGLAVAREMALQGRETILLERESAFGTISSARNSEVIHAGIYYPKDSLKAKLCVEGNRMLYEYCRTHHVATQPYGKLIVASDESQLDDLQAILYRAQQNQVPEIKMITGEQAKAMEPELHCAAAVLSASTGIVDSHGFMLSLLGGFEDAGGMIAYQSPLISAKPIGDNAKDGFELEIGGADGMKIQTKLLINCAGMSAPAIARKIEGLSQEHIPKAYFAKGNYFSLSGKSPFKHLIYPIPEPGGLGVHLTLDMGGQAKFGPDVEWLEIDEESQIDYTVNPKRGDGFYEAVRRYWPGLKDNALQPDYSGVRAKIVPPNAPAGDFCFNTPKNHGLEGLFNLYGFESPGLTSSLAIAKHLEGLIKRS